MALVFRSDFLNPSASKRRDMLAFRFLYLLFYISFSLVKTTRLTGGLHKPYKGLLLAGLTPLKFYQLQTFPNYRLTAVFLFVLFCLLTRKRVYILFQTQLLIFLIFSQLVLYIFCYLLFILPDRCDQTLWTLSAKGRERA